MDPITHGLLGGVTAQALHRRPVASYVAWAGAAGGMFPDLDVLIRSSSDPLLSIAYHRHFTHALAFIPLGGLIAALLFWLITRRRHPFWGVYFAATVGYATHALLDACTTYGTVLLWPFSMARISWDIISIIDPVFSLILLAGLLVVLVRGRPGAARIALVFALAYLGLGFLQHQRILEFQQEVATSRGQTVERGRVYPSFGNLLLWRSLYQDKGRLFIDALRHSPFTGKRLWAGGSVPVFSPEKLVPPPPPGSTLENDLKVYQWFAEGYLSEMGQSPWVLGDMRFGFLPNDTRPLWGIAFSPADPSLHVKKIRFPGDRFGAWDRFWEMLFITLPSVSSGLEKGLPLQHSKLETHI